MNSPTPSAKLSISELCHLGIFAALIFATKVALSGIPNVNLNAVLIIIATVYYGWKALYAVMTYVMLEGLVYGFSIWWFCYLYAWPLLVVAAMLLRKNRSPLIWAILAGLYGLLFGPLMYIGYFLALGGWKGFGAMWIAGIPYDLIHAVSNFVLVLLLFKPLSGVMERLIPGRDAALSREAGAGAAETASSEAVPSAGPENARESDRKKVQDES